ncbi:iron-regulated transporter [Penicillium lagena]|uniref:iron-regulated transporter n=1 Tax=Penicillium lagena TaxID=94218 RepID=UPI0025410FEE|nr:iron-regulated transporter [Penicillium lagena]KAJ5604584.1 iron-regulated transporter [Penicillium lagena]
MAKLIAEQTAPDERTPLIQDETGEIQSYSPQEQEDHAEDRLQTNIAYRLYISHFLSTWNSRVFEFGAVLYLATIYPGTLLPMSVYALSRGLAAIFFAPAVGHYIDVGNRLQVVRVSIGAFLSVIRSSKKRKCLLKSLTAIVLQRLVVATSCAIFYFLTIRLDMPQVVDNYLLVTLALLACIEKLCSIMNLVSVEKDWMRRIDLICKLVGPLFIALIDGISTKAAILVNLGMNVSSVIVEYFSIAQVYDRVPDLQKPKQAAAGESPRDEGNLSNLWRSWCILMRKTLEDITAYFHHRVVLPSFAGTLLYLTVLSFAGQMVTWLLSAGYDSTQIAIARTLSVTFEVLATWVAPWLMGKIGPVRAGIWLANWQITCLSSGIVIFWRFSNYPLISASGLVGGTILSRVGLRGFDLCVQILVQEGVETTARGSFSSTEAAWQNLFEICSYISTIVFSRPDQFKWPALISVIAVGVAGFVYAIFVRIQRGHLVHLPKLFSQEHQQHSRQRGLESISSSSDF